MMLQRPSHTDMEDNEPNFIEEYNDNLGRNQNNLQQMSKFSISRDNIQLDLNE